jgi:hypothetical protein
MAIVKYSFVSSPKASGYVIAFIPSSLAFLSSGFSDGIAGEYITKSQSLLMFFSLCPIFIFIHKDFRLFVISDDTASDPDVFPPFL